MVYYAVKRLEKKFPFFNQCLLEVDDLLNWATYLGIKAIPDFTLDRALSTITPNKNKLIIYNPTLHPDDLILTLGHELGHHLLGHVEHADVLFSGASVFCTRGLEKDAGIIGFLCWLPTWRLERLEQQGRLDVQELAWELKNCDTEWEFLLRACRARMAIYKGLKRLLNLF